jgi:hypothetical protein
MMAKRWGPGWLRYNEPFLFGRAEGCAWFAPHGWRELEWRSSFGESLKLKRTLRGGHLFWGFMDKLQSRKRRAIGRRMSGILLMGNVDDPGASLP